jgi:hypothetical protein
LSRDFTLEKYDDLCQALRDSGYTIQTVRKYLENSENRIRKIAIVRHDVDRKISNALRMAELEQTLGISSTYYFRYPSTFKPEIITAIRDMGHEIGYHYETLSTAKGDLKKAITLFERELRSLRTVAEIHTICMHGSPLSPYDNRDLWKTYDFRKFDILGEAYLSVKEATYLSDTGRNWSGKHSIRDVMPDRIGMPIPRSVETTDDLIVYIRSRACDSLYLTIHPERWALNNREWLMGVLTDWVMNTGKKIIRVVRA